MLYKYKSDYEKIAMGLLSFIPDLKEFAKLNGTKLTVPMCYIYGRMRIVILLVF